jgi:hypothetical protein
MSEAQKRLDFVQNVLPKLIIERNNELMNHEIVKCTAKASNELDGFMSSVYFIDLTLKNADGR